MEVRKKFNTKTQTRTKVNGIVEDMVEGMTEGKKKDKIAILLEGLAAGECEGIKGSTTYKIADYCMKKGLI